MNVFVCLFEALQFPFIATKRPEQCPCALNGLCEDKVCQEELEWSTQHSNLSPLMLLLKRIHFARIFIIDGYMLVKRFPAVQYVHVQYSNTDTHFCH